jgi:NDP-sugar pyrophosphorylase family protein
MDVLILCGGRGTRLNGERPKPLIEIGGRPIVAAYRHTGFWRCLDTAKDAVALEELCASGAPWLGRTSTAAG